MVYDYNQYNEVWYNNDVEWNRKIIDTISETDRHLHEIDNILSWCIK